MASHKKIPKKDSPKVGRPATGRQRTEQMVVRLTDEERAAIEAAAETAGQPATVWAREQLLQAAHKTPPLRP